MIVEHLKRFGTVEPLEALREYGIYRLGAVIFDLKAEGMHIISRKQHLRSPVTGRPVQFAKYYLEPAPSNDPLP